MIKKFLYIMVILFAMGNIAFGADATASSSTSISYTIDNDYQSDDNYFRCQKLNNKNYTTQIVGYDLLNGITYCRNYVANAQECACKSCEMVI